MHTDKPTTEQSNRSHNNAFSRTLSCFLFYQRKKKTVKRRRTHSRVCAGKSATYLQLLINMNEVFSNH